MNQNEVVTLVKFNFWANGRILNTCKQLTPDQFTQTLIPNPGWSSLRGILVHTLDTEYGWRTALQNLGDTIMKETDFPDVATLETRWHIEKETWLDFVNGLSNEQLNSGYGENPQNSPAVWQTIMHVMTHSIQHRSEAAFILTGLGHSPGELDFDVFLEDKSYITANDQQ